MRPLLLCLALAAGVPLAARRPGPATIVVVERPVLDSMSAIWTSGNANWDQLADLNWMERSLGTVRATQREYLGCLQGELRGDSAIVRGFVPARNMKRLMLAVTGDCSGVAGYLGTFHTHPYLADTQNRATKQRFLAPQDLMSFRDSEDRLALVVWDVDSLDAAIRVSDDSILHPALVVVREAAER